MADTPPLARSPISPAPPEAVTGGWVVSGSRSGAALTLTDCTPLAKVAVRAGPDGAMARDLGVPFGSAARQSLAAGTSDDEVLVVGSGPGEWLVLAAPGQQAGLVGLLSSLAGDQDEPVSVVDMTHGRALIRIAGERSADLLAKECAVDLGERTFPPGAALRSAVAGLATDLVRDDRGGTRSYLLHCERSSGQYLYDSLLDAGAEFGAETDGFVLPGI